MNTSTKVVYHSMKQEERPRHYPSYSVLSPCYWVYGRPLCQP
jgi:hypothetical protein